jgi:hypothetical protein
MAQAGSKRPTKRPDGKNSEELGKHIGRELRTMFDDVVAEPVPERFQKLLEELERKSRSDGDK